MNRVQESRREVEARLAQLRDAMTSEFGHAPRRKAWLVALLVGAAGLAVALRRRGGRHGRSRKRKLHA